MKTWGDRLREEERPREAWGDVLRLESRDPKVTRI
jgi:hypothetical protein